jgi:hypothetical protein
VLELNLQTQPVEESWVVTLYYLMCYIVLCVRTKSSDSACRGELGSYPLLFDVLYNMIKYWCHLTKTREKSSLLYDSYIVCQELESHEQESWMGCIKELFNYFSLQSIYKNNEKFKESYILNKVKTSLKEKLCKIWLDDMQNVKRKNPLHQNKLRTYRKFKNIFKLEPYLINCNKQQR